MPTAAILNQERERWSRNKAQVISASDAAMSATIVKQTQIPITATSASLNGSLVKLTKAILSAIGAAFNGSLVKKTLKSLVAVSAAFNGSLVKLTKIILSAVGAAFSGSLVKLTKAVLSAVNAAFNGSLVKKTLKALAGVAAAFNGSLVKLTTVILSAVSAAFNGSLVKKTLKVLAATASAFNGALSKFKLHVQVLVASMTALSGGVVKKTLKSVSAISSAISGAQSKLISHSLVAGAAALSGSVNKFTKKFFNAISSAWSAIVNPVKQSAPPPPPTVYRPIVLGASLRSSGVSFSNPSIITTASNSLQQFQFGGSQFLVAASSTNLVGRSYKVVAGGNVVVPPSASGAALNLVLTLKGFSQRVRPSIVTHDDILAILPGGQPLSIGTTPWQLTCRVSAAHGGITGSQSSKVGGSLIVNYKMVIGGVSFSGTSLPGNNPFLKGVLRLSLGAQFSGSVSGADMFQANLFQFDTQQ
jgi:hypothetical protein